MALWRLLFGIVCMPIFAQSSPNLPAAIVDAPAQQAADLRARIEAAPRLTLQQTDLPMHLPPGWQLGKVSWVAQDRKTGITWLIQRGEGADPIIALDPQGNVIHSFGKGLFKIPHAIRLDPQGNVWTVDAGSSVILKFSPEGVKLLQIDVAGQPATKSPFRGTTDIAFGPNGHLFITDGYANARVLEYSAAGVKLHEWATPGTAPGQLHLPHSIVIDRDMILYIADRENGRIEKFSLTGQFLGEIPNLGRTYSLQLAPDGALWAGMAPLDQPTGAPGWLVKLDRTTGALLGYVPVTEQGGLHTVEVTVDGRPMTAIGNRIVTFRKP